jgi:hypothetical protein
MRPLPRACAILFSAAFAACGSAPPPPPPAAPASEADRLERDGVVACEEGALKIRQAVAFAEGRTLTGPEEDRLKADLQEGCRKIVAGMELLDRCNQRTGRTFDTRPYTEAAKAARMKLQELK